MSSTPSPAVRWYHRLVTPNPDAEAEHGGSERVAAGGLRLVAANALQSAGDQVVNAKTVLPWLFAVLGAPAALVALLVPLRESGSMLPQAALTPWVLRAPRRTRVWMLGAAVQGLSVLAMVAVTLLLRGAAAGVGLLVALAVFALARALCSMASKDVQGRAVPKGQRGQVTGVATAVSGVVAVAVGVALQLLGPDLSAGVLAAFLGGAALTWLVGVVVYAGIPEQPETGGEGQETGAWLRELVELLRADRGLRHFVVARGLLLVSALAPPFLVTIAVAQGSALLAGLGSFVIAQGVASVIGGRVFGRWSDRSSRLVMTWGSAVASLTVLAVVVVVALGRGRSRVLGLETADLVVPALVAGYFLISLVHVGVRVARKTYVVDMAQGDRRTRYVAVANTAIGALLLAVGALSAVLALWGELPALVLLAVAGLLGAVVSWRLPEVTRPG